MALIPRMLRPSVLIRRKAMYAGFLGPSRFWKIVGIWVFGKASIKKFFGKNPEVIDAAALGSGRFMQVATAKPVTRRERKKLVKAGMAPPSLKEHRELGTLWARSHVKSRKAS
jgi:hypothetical protein